MLHDWASSLVQFCIMVYQLQTYWLKNNSLSFSWFSGYAGWSLLVSWAYSCSWDGWSKEASLTFLAQGTGSWLGTSGPLILCRLDQLLYLVVSGQWTKEVKLEATESLKAYLEFGVEWRHFYHLVVVEASHKPTPDSSVGKYTPPLDKKRGEVPLQRECTQKDVTG